MEITEAKRYLAKQELESVIRYVIQSYEVRTGLSVESIDITHGRLANGMLLSVGIDVKVAHNEPFSTPVSN